MSATIHHPKGSMCMSCLYRGADCSAFNFARMKVSRQYSNKNDPTVFKVVICDELKTAKAL